MNARSFAAPLLLGAGLGGVGCASLLGGLEEGAARVGADSGSSIDAGADATTTCRWLDGYRYRVPVRIDHHGPTVDAYQVSVVLPTTALVATGRMRSDGSDLRVTLADGVTLAPHWLEGGVGTEATKLWVSLDLGTEPVDAWLYYGAPDALSVSSIEQTFVGGVLENPMFDSDRGWTTYQRGVGAPSSTNQASATLGGGTATLWLARESEPMDAEIGICQPIQLPSGSDYRIVFDVDLALAEHASGSLRFSALPPPIWSTQKDNLVAPVIRAAAETVPLPFAGAGTLCFVAFVEAATLSGPGVRIAFAKIRVRRWLDGDRAGLIAGPETTACTR